MGTAYSKFVLASGKIGKFYIFDTFWPDCVHNVCKNLKVEIELT